MKAKKYEGGGKFPPKVRAMKERAAKKKAAKNAPLKGGMLAETTVTAKAPKPNEKIKREVNKPVGSDFTFLGDPGGKGKLVVKAASGGLKSLRTGRSAASVGKRGLDAAKDLLNKTAAEAKTMGSRVLSERKRYLSDKSQSAATGYIKAIKDGDKKTAALKKSKALKAAKEHDIMHSVTTSYTNPPKFSRPQVQSVRKKMDEGYRMQTYLKDPSKTAEWGLKKKPKKSYAQGGKITGKLFNKAKKK